MSTPLHDMMTPATPDQTDPAAVELDDWDEDVETSGPSRRTSVVRLLLVAGIVAALAFTAGVSVQKRTSEDSASASGLPAGLGAGGSLPAGLSSLLGGGGGGGGAAPTSTAAVVGTVVKVDGDVITVEDLGGNRYQVTTGPTTTITATRTLTSAQLSAGQSVTVNGTKHTDGTVDATAVTAR